MSNVITFLEQLGQDPTLAGRSPEAYAAAVDALGLDNAPREALLARDAETLSGLLGGRVQMMCFLFPADGDDQKSKDEPADDGEQPDQEKKESIRRDGLH